ncbi:serine/threonine-protein kinase SMG1 isoform X2 [Strongylocentrotus purpuratus]|uniref:non-specific serine/threonine protein kinase n=1 Tax=Strongylocentrotus purpuratus TaxID=7668 RepID=A0A7M7NV96_STRPU|nr:serine/threonine-protein kinase SMG1 isoform X2 [Strongylocentrotus purpuratus]
MRKQQGRKLFTDHSVLSSLLHRIGKDDDKERRLSACQQLLDFLTNKDHSREIQKQNDSILSAISSVLCDRVSNSIKLELSQCIAAVSIHTGQDLKRFFGWAFTKFQNSSNDEYKTYMFYAVFQALRKNSSNPRLLPLMNGIMKDLQITLENVDTPDLLVSVMNIVHYVSQQYPKLFGAFFKDTVDIIVGWYIDTTQKEVLLKYCEDSLSSFSRYWQADLGFSANLLSQFLEDMEAYAEDYHQQTQGSAARGGSAPPRSDGYDNDEILTPDVCKNKILALMRVYTTVVKCLDKEFIPVSSPPITVDYISQVLSGIPKCARILTAITPDPALCHIATKCLIAVLDCIQDNLTKCKHDLFTFALSEVERVIQSEKTPASELVLHMTLLYKVIRHSREMVPAEIIQRLLEPGSKIASLKYHTNPQVMTCLMKTVQSLLNVKDVPTLELTYGFLLLDLQSSYNRLLSYLNSEVKCQLTSEGSNGIKESSLLDSIQGAEMIIIFTLAALSDISSAKSSIMGMWVFSPSIFDLLTLHLSPTHWDIALGFPSTYYTILHMLYTHSKSNGHFISSSFGLTAASKTRTNFSRILALLPEVLTSPAVSDESRSLALCWMLSILQYLQQGSYSAVCLTVAFTEAVTALVHVALHEDPSITLQAAQCMGLVIKHARPPKEFLISCLEVCRTRLVSSHDDVKRAFTDLMLSLPCDILYSSDIAPVSPSQHSEDKHDGRENSSDDIIQNLHILQRTRQKHMGSIPNTTFNSHNYRTVMAYILLGEAPKNTKWLERLFHSCQRPHNSVHKYDKGNISLPAFINDNQAVQWFWATWEAANFCVLSKLRTPLGKPQETFTAIRSALSEFVTDMKMEDSSSSANDKMTAFSEEYKCAQLRPVLLLQYLEHLEKLMYNAYEGSAVALPSMPKPVKAFFRTNRETCHEGFALVRPLAYNLAMHCSQYASALHHAMTMLQDLVAKNNTTGHAFEDCLQRVIAPLVRLQCPQSILGLQTWCAKVIGRSFSWPDPMVLKADKKFESCVTDTLNTIKDYLNLDEIAHHAALTKATRQTKAAARSTSSPPNSPPGGRDGMNPKLLTRGMEPPPPSQSGAVVGYLLLEVMDCYERLTDYDSALKWQESVQLLRGKVHSALKSNVKLQTDTNILKALSHFNERDFPAVSDQLALIPGMSLDDLNPKDPSVGIAAVHSPRLLLRAGQLEQARALTHYHLSGCASSFPTTSSNKGVVCTHPQLPLVVEALNTVSKLAESSLQMVWLDWPVVPTPSHTMLLQTTDIIKKTIQDPSQLYLLPLSTDLQLNPSQHDLTMMTEATRVTSYQLYLHSQVTTSDNNMGTISELRCHLSKLRLATSRLARKQTNFLAAQKILLEQLDFIAPDGVNSQNLDKKLMNLEIHAKKPSQPLLTALSTIDPQIVTSLDVLRTERECSKLLHYMGNQIESWAQLSKTVVHYATLAANSKYVLLPSDVSDMTDLCARSLLSMVKWMTADYRTALPYLKQCHRLDLSDVPELSCSLGMLLDMEKHGALQGHGLAAYGVREADVTNLIGQSPAVSDTDAVCGRLLHLGIMQSPSLPKAWSSLASWCYRWGRKAVDMASEDKGVVLTEGEKATVLTVLPAEITNADTDEILRVLSQAHCTISSMQEEDIVEQGQAHYHDGSETTRLLLTSVCPSLADMDPSVMEHLLDVWGAVCRRIFSHYRLSVWSYFTFLKLNGGNALDGRDSPIAQLNTSSNNAKTELNLNNSSAGGGGRSGGHGTESESIVGFGRQEDNNITATLRLLRLLVKYASELRDVLEEGFATTPTGPWKSIIPQLFSRLNHPEAYVRQSISDLLCRIAKDAPHLIVYQAVVGCPDTGTAEVENQIAQPSSITNFLTSPQVASSLQDSLLSPSLQGGTDSQQGEEQDGEGVQEEEGEEEEQKQHDHSMHLLEDCLRALVSTLSQHDANLVSQVEVLVQELRRITLLWEEVWIGTLTQIQSDVTRRLEKLEEEAKRVSRNESLEHRQKRALMMKKHQAIMKPIVFTLEQLHGITNKPADTPNERAFQEAFKDQLECAIKSLKYPDNPEQPQQSWAPFKQLGHMLQQRSNRRSTFLLQMSEISPKLAKMKSTAIPLPGHVGHTNQVVHIESFINTVNILPTKTKPKKLVFLGSDGKKYTYLFKGLEDLHLDERIMQFLSIVNCMFARNKRQDAPLFHACHYSVTPLGPRSGLISWVDGASALFSLYKRWQQREAVAAAAASKVGDNSNPPPVAKPSEIFYNKVTKALKEEGLSSQTPRKDWPLSMMRKVLQDLMADTPDYLLAKELWCSSGSASEWWHLTQAFGRSTAVMSMIGYIIGLGDRHLDNVLVNFVTGEVVHIDYNVCFEKGKNLRVPERVPFRMTQNVQAALGITGVEGNFRQSSEEVLKIMRKGRETLLNLLEAFVYDPLVDWTTGNDRGFAGGIYGGGQVNPAAPEMGLNKKEVEVEITRSLFQSRVFEMREAWTQNQEDMLDAMVKLEEHLDTLLEDVEEKREMENEGKRFEQHLQESQTALRDKDHSLHTLNERYRDHRQLLEARDNAVKSVEAQLQDLYNHHIQHKIALEAIQDLAALSQQVEQPLDVGAPSYVPAVGFLQNAGQAQIIQQCEQAESEMEKVLKQRRELVVSCVEILKAYYSMVTLFPPNFYEMTRTFVWHHWLQQLLQSFTSDMCGDILASFESCYAPTTPTRIQEVVAMEIQLQDLVATAGANLTLTADWTIGSIERETAEGQMTQSMAELTHWIQEHESAAPPLVTLNMMNLLHMYASTTLLMENSMSANMSPEYSSRNGRWFLSELSGTLTNIEAVMGIISLGIQPESEDPCSLSNLIACFKAVTAVYEQLQTLLHHFSDVASEAVRLIQSRDASVVSSLAALDALCTDPQVSLHSIIYQIETDLHAAEPNTQASSSEMVKELRAKFDSLLHPSARTHKPADDSQTPDPAASQPPTMGQNLLAAIHVLFKRLGQSLEEFTECWDKVAFPQEWFKVDGVFFEAVSPKTMTVCKYTIPLLSDLFFVKQLETAHKCLTKCRNHALALSGLPHELVDNGLVYQDVNELVGFIHSDEMLVRPVKLFIVDFISTALLGIPSTILGLCVCCLAHQLGLDTTNPNISQPHNGPMDAPYKLPLDDLCQKAAQEAVETGRVDGPEGSSVQHIIRMYDTASRARGEACQQHQSLENAQDINRRAQTQLLRFQWLYEDILQAAGPDRAGYQFIPPARSAIMSDMRKRLQALQSIEGAIGTMQERALGVQGRVCQRLKWAAGANPSLANVMKDVDASIQDKTQLYTLETKRASEIGALCHAILHFEGMRTRTSESVYADNGFHDILQRCLQVCNSLETRSANLSLAEEDYLALKPLTIDRPINNKWIKGLSESIRKKVTECQGKAAEAEAKIEADKETVQTMVDVVKMGLTTHNELMSEVKGMLRVIAEDEEGGSAGMAEAQRFKTFYKQYSETFATMLGRILTTSSHDNSEKLQELIEVKPTIHSLIDHVKGMYDRLVCIATQSTEDEDGEGDKKSVSGSTEAPGTTDSKPTKPPGGELTEEDLRPQGKPTTKQQQQVKIREVHHATPPTAKQGQAKGSPAIMRDPRTGKIIQVRNTYAINVWRRVKGKLDGRDPEPSKRLAVTEQVDYVIKEATSIDNLATLYEGWTAWV